MAARACFYVSPCDDDQGRTWDIIERWSDADVVFASCIRSRVEARRQCAALNAQASPPPPPVAYCARCDRAFEGELGGIGDICPECGWEVDDVDADGWSSANGQSLIMVRRIEGVVRLYMEQLRE